VTLYLAVTNHIPQSLRLDSTSERLQERTSFVGLWGGVWVLVHTSVNEDIHTFILSI